MSCDGSAELQVIQKEMLNLLEELKQHKKLAAFVNDRLMYIIVKSGEQELKVMIENFIVKEKFDLEIKLDKLKYQCETHRNQCIESVNNYSYVNILQER